MSSLAASSSNYSTNYGPRREALKRAPATAKRPLKLVVVALSAVAQAREVATPNKGRVAIAALFAAATVLHIGVYALLGDAGHAPAPLKKVNTIALDLAPPPPPPPPPPEPPKPQPQVAKVPTPALAKAPPPLPVVADASDGPADADTVQVSATPQPPAPPAPAPAPPPPPPEPVTEPRGFAGYLKNPAPEYPLVAQERGMQGRVVLKVHVLASGKPDSVTVDTSSGFKILDDSAVKAVLTWSFDPAKRGSTPIDGWVKVPLSFKL